MAMEGKRMMKANTAYIGSRNQLKQAMIEEGKSDSKSDKAKNYFKEAGAQKVMDSFQARIEDTLELAFDEWTVTECMGDNIRRCIAKVQVSPEDYVHVYCSKEVRKDPWAGRYSAFHRATDPLSDNKHDYEEIPDDAAICFWVHPDSNKDVCVLQ
mmetsp:Transcript_60033/g.105074  ORF Transcript_60033/g.105074 Transcript_60033/m.105074 type:complete len:155 (-) Transcript_60033:128-592(-)